ncbi:MAG: sensor histidine kinase [Paludibacter sp.]|nr:sensor histidine kinase [Paludibacter sp.]
MRNITMIRTLGVLLLLLIMLHSAKAVDPVKREHELLSKLKKEKLTEEEKIIVWYNLAAVYVGYKPSEAIKYAEKLMAYDHRLSKQYGRMIKGGITLNAAHYDSARVFLEEARENFLSQFPTDNKMGSEIYNRLGHISTAESLPEKAIEYYIQALKYSTKIDDYSQMCAICTNISYLYGQVGAGNKIKLEYAYKALEYAEKSNDPWALEQAYSTLGNTLQEADSIDKALVYQKKGLELSHLMKSEQKECFAALNIGCTYLSMQKPAIAEAYFNRALLLAKKNDLKRPEAYILSCLSDVYRELKQFAKSSSYISEALQKKDALSNSEQLDLYETALALTVAKGDIKSFEKQFKAYQEQAAKVQDVSVREKMMELEAKYETEKNEQQIKDLAERQKIIIAIASVGTLALIAIVFALFFRIQLEKSRKKMAEQEVVKLKQEKLIIATQSVLEGETVERSRLARELHDGLGGMLSVVRLNLKGITLTTSLENEDANKFSKALSVLDTSIKELRRVAHHLMPESLQKHGLNVSLTDFCMDIPSVEFHYFGNNERFDSKLEILIYRMAHELVNNALNHAEAEHINVQLLQEDDRISLTVQDDGKGFDEKNTGKGMGLENVKNRVASFDGEMNIYSSPEKGTEINIEFQLNSEKHDNRTNC